MRMRNILVAGVLGAVSVCAVGCGGGSPMPSADNKAALQAVEASEIVAQSAIPISASLLARDQAPGSGGDARVEMQQQVQQAMDNGNCKETQTGLSGILNGQVDPMSGVSGS